jgi:hypothetical protein
MFCSTDCGLDEDGTRKDLEINMATTDDCCPGEHSGILR